MNEPLQGADHMDVFKAPAPAPNTDTGGQRWRIFHGDIDKLCFICKTPRGKTKGPDGVDIIEYCGGTVEGTPESILTDKEHRFVIQCPKCKSEFSRGMRTHIASDQAKACCEFVKALRRAHFDVAYILKAPAEVV